MKYEHEGSLIGQERISIQSKLAGSLEQGLKDLSVARRSMILYTICETACETRELLQLPRDMVIYIEASEFLEDAAYGIETAASAYVEKSTWPDGSVLYHGYLLFRPSSLRYNSRWQVMETTAHEMYHLREQVRFPNRHRLRIEDFESDPENEAIRKGHYAVRNELAADLFALGYLKHKQPKTLKDRIDKISTLCESKMASHLRRMKSKRMIRSIR